MMPGFPLAELEALGAHLKQRGMEVRLLVVGGAALRMLGVIPRATRDVDVLAMIGEQGELEPPGLAAIQDLIEFVARDFALSPGWLNEEVGMQWKQGLPPDPLAGAEWRRFGGLHVVLAGRQLSISLKLFAAADRSPSSVHCQDLIALRPTTHELEQARAWVVTQDIGAAWPAIVDEVITHVETRTGNR